MFIRKENMIQKGDHILAGVSGGADSVCLLVLLHSLMDELSFKLDIRHLAVHLADFMDSRAVYIAEWKVVEQVIERVDVELFPK